MRFVILFLGALVLAMGFYLTGRRESAALVRMQPPASEVSSAPGALQKYWPVPEFSLQDRTGRPVTLGDLKGKVWAADFFYASCPGPCPMISSSLAEVQKSLGKAADVRLVSISTDPINDTPDALEAYAKRFHADDRWYFLTGDKEQLYKLANQGFKLSVTENPAAVGERIIHSTRVALVDRQGFVRGFYDGTDAEAIHRLTKDIGTLLGETP